MSFPRVTVDDTRVLAEPQACPANVNQFYDSLLARDNWFYRALQAYMFTVLKWRDRLPESFVRREFLPVGDPDTDYFYGAVVAGSAFAAHVSPGVLARYDVYATLYNRSSFPSSSWQQQTETHQTEPAQGNGFYLMRLRRKPGLGAVQATAEKLEKADFDCQIVEADRVVTLKIDLVNPTSRIRPLGPDGCIRMDSA